MSQFNISYSLSLAISSPQGNILEYGRAAVLSKSFPFATHGYCFWGIAGWFATVSTSPQVNCIHIVSFFGQPQQSLPPMITIYKQSVHQNDGFTRQWSCLLVSNLLIFPRIELIGLIRGRRYFGRRRCVSRNVFKPSEDESSNERQRTSPRLHCGNGMRRGMRMSLGRFQTCYRRFRRVSLGREVRAKVTRRMPKRRVSSYTGEQQ
jgi:hypothetical protein